jgi:hypothetical protein
VQQREHPQRQAGQGKTDQASTARRAVAPATEQWINTAIEQAGCQQQGTQQAQAHAGRFGIQPRHMDIHR